MSHSTYIKLFKCNQSAIKCRCILRKITHNGPILMKLCQRVLGVCFFETQCSVYVCVCEGIMAILFCGIVMSHYTHLNLSPVTQITTQLTFRTIAFIAGAIQQLMPAAAYYSVKSCLSLLLIY